ncbi:AAA family ATPase [Polycladidibacter stylochi]|uniref:AAA family ATPase n=1 Tax=Polycladidibacter stylochi TaxID=1807766 RepID=UPI0008342D5E|nr:MoxR family ATPase [Pseudovibrio stylochi]
MNAEPLHESLHRLSTSLSSQVVGQEHVVERLIIALIANGHVLLEGLPGTAKTRSVRCLAQALGTELGRVQFTPDLMPSDVVGYEITNDSGGLVFQPGPVFTNIMLADEINRAPPKVQSSLLEAMEERQVTLGGKSHALPELFLVLATQNPIEQEGTYPLPEAQMDRFLLKVTVDYPREDGELEVLRLVKREEAAVAPMVQVDKAAIFQARKELISLHTSEAIEKYIVNLIMATRAPERFADSDLQHWISVGTSPRGTIALEKCARAHALLKGKGYIDPDDVRAVIESVLSHRIILSFDALADGVTPKDVILEIIRQVPVEA